MAEKRVIWCYISDLFFIFLVCSQTVLSVDPPTAPTTANIIANTNVAVLTETMQPILSLTTASLQDCCQAAGVSSNCMMFCTTDMSVFEANIMQAYMCSNYVNTLLTCASGGRSFALCCAERKISDSCMDLCSGVATNMHATTACMQDIPTVINLLYCSSRSDPASTTVAMTTRSTSVIPPSTDGDRCLLQPETGLCRGNFEYWYYDHLSNTCKTFVYGGCKGNNNRFETQMDCLNACSSSPSPTSEVSATIGVETVGSTVISDICSLPKDTGPCSESYSMWYYDPVSKSCHNFVYGGCGGNRNNFKAQSDCLNACSPPESRAASTTIPLNMGPTTVIPARMGPVTQVETLPPTKVETVTIPPTRIPTSLSMTTMSLAEICALPSDTGRCRAAFQFWFYDPQSDSCKTFTYGGCGGNENRWPTEAGCMNACSSSSPSSTPADLTPVGSTAIPWINSICQLAPMPGFCGEGKFYMWYYDVPSRSCQKYSLGCTGGNNNNFHTEDDCMNVCITTDRAAVSNPVAPSITPSALDGICSLAPAMGFCGAGSISLWYFDSQSRSCKMYSPGCQGANANQFQSEADCMNICSSPITATVSPIPNSPSQPAFCLSSPSFGISCMEANVTRWFHNAATNSCQAFQFGGCQGNFNNFASSEICQRVCTSTQDVTQCPPVVMDNCDCKLEMDSNGCQICECQNDPCKDFVCSVGQSCVIQRISCQSSNCHDSYQPLCLDASTVTSTSATTSSPVVCPVNNCSITCQYGYKKDQSGCYTCHCFDPCQDFSCPTGQVCHPTQYRKCFDDMCEMLYVGSCLGPSPTCGPLTCALNCSYGYSKDASGCNLCQCFDPCLTLQCPSSCRVTNSTTCQNGVCQTQYVGSCFNANCNTSACPLNCSYGLEEDGNGCKICRCLDPCQNVRCSAAEVCQVDQTPVFVSNPDGSLKRLFLGNCVPVPPTTCSPVMCMMMCDYGFLQDSNGCDMCRCAPDPCQNVTCGAGMVCNATQISGTMHYMAKCSAKCSLVMCLMFCDYGFVQDSNGCDTCKCAPNPCQNVTCGAGMVCNATQINGTMHYTAKCSVPPTTCSPVMCLMTCDYGFVQDSNGCDMCRCAPNPCQNVTCGAGMVCNATQITGTMHYTAKCSARCSLVMCSMFCDYGFVQDSNGCDTCKCAPNPCQNVTCGAGMVCNATQINGTMHYTAKCSARCSLVMCLMFCDYGFVQDSNGCDTCKCAPNPCQNFTCAPGFVCNATRSDATARYMASCSQCTNITCPNTCWFGYKRNQFGCSTCECAADPCQGQTCLPGDQCQPVFIPNCSNEICLPTYACVDKSSQCSNLQQVYQTIYLDKSKVGATLTSNGMPQLNCDSRGQFKPLQCINNVCWCVDPSGVPQVSTRIDQSRINNTYCSPYGKVNGTIKINADFNIITTGNSWLFKQQMSQQVANMLQIPDTLVTVTGYKSGSIIVFFDAAASSQTSLSAVQSALQQQLNGQPVVVTFNNVSYNAVLFNGTDNSVYTVSVPPLTTTPTTTPTPVHNTPSTTTTSSWHQPTSPAPSKQPANEKIASQPMLLLLLLLLLIIPILLIFIIVFCICKLKRSSKPLNTSTDKNEFTNEPADHTDQGYVNSSYKKIDIYDHSEKNLSTDA